MALMFDRMAYNFANNGYYPTDNETLSRILSALSTAASGKMKIFDPCAGEGLALSECKKHLGADRTQAFGIEYDESRAWHAKSLLDKCIHADMQQCMFSKKSFGLLFLNPPYGDLVSDNTHTGFVQKGRKRLEKLFYQKTLPSLQYGGILVLIIPVYSLDAELAHWISHCFDRVEIFAAPLQRYQQVVIFGIRTDSDDLDNIAQNKAKLLQFADQPVELPATWESQQYVVPRCCSSDMKFFASSLDAKQLSDEITHNSCLWEQFHQRFANHVAVPRQPLMPLSQWHLALSLAAGQVSGVVNSDDGRTFIIRGDTYKEANISQHFEEDEEGNYTEVTTSLDKFVPVIRALDMTPQSPTFGEVLTIR